MNFLLCFLLLLALTATDVKPDLTVAADGSGDFRTVQSALDSIPKDNRQRTIVFIKDGTYREKIRVEAPRVTLRGQTQRGTRIEFAQRDGDFHQKPDAIGRAVSTCTATIACSRASRSSTRSASSGRTRWPFMARPIAR